MGDINKLTIMAIDDFSGCAQYKTDECLVDGFTKFMDDNFGIEEVESMYSGDIAGMFMAFCSGKKYSDKSNEFIPGLSGESKVAFQLGEKLSEAHCALYHLQQSIATVEICGVPIHHLSFDISKHFTGVEISFVKEVQAKAVLDFCKALRKEVSEKMPDGCSDQMLDGWKSGVMDARDAGYAYADAIVFEHQKEFIKIRKEAQ